MLPSLVAAAVVLVALARWWHPDSLLALAALGALWTLGAGAAIWRFGLEGAERATVRRQLGRRPVAAAATEGVA